MSFLVLPPEINSVRMFSGAGSAPLLEAAAAWNTLASELDSAAGSFSAMTSGLAGEAWQGAASKAMLAAAAPYAGWLSTAATQAFGASAQAQAVAGAFESALAATVHPVMVAANRSDLVSLVLSNLFGQNAPAIAAAESVYEEMWAQDVAAMVEYHAGAAAAAAQLVLPAQRASCPTSVTAMSVKAISASSTPAPSTWASATSAPTSPPPTRSPCSAVSASPTTVSSTSAPGTTAVSTWASPTPAPTSPPPTRSLNSAASVLPTTASITSASPMFVVALGRG
nr:PPE family protein [Mycobacterium riyadhense]